MVPKASSPAKIVPTTENEISATKTSTSSFRFYDRKLRLRWYRVVQIGLMHVAGLYGFYLTLTSAKWLTCFWGFFMHTSGLLGVSLGAHRLWSHKAFKAKPPLAILLMILDTLAYQDTAIRWARDHRLHHKWCDTDADPYNASRGFFFAHVGWFLCDRLPETRDKGKDLDLSDLLNDPVLHFQKKYYYYMVLVFAFIIPIIVPMYFWGETFHTALFLNFLRHVTTMNVVFFINSIEHNFGNKPYDKFLPGNEVPLMIITLGDQSHNYHHAFPRDYKLSELRDYSTHFSTLFIDIMAKIGWAYDLKTTPREYIMQRVKKNGDGTHYLWGCGDKEQEEINEDLAAFREVY